MSHFIELTNINHGQCKTVEINSMLIESMSRVEREENPYTRVITFGGSLYEVKETPKVIKKLMDTKKITYFNQEQ